MMTPLFSLGLSLLVPVSTAPMSADAFSSPHPHLYQKRRFALTSTYLNEGMNNGDNFTEQKGVGLYRPFAEHAWNKLLRETDWFLPDTSIPSDLSCREAPAKGFPEGSVVKIETRALQPAKPSLVRYARYALLETLVPPSSSQKMIQGVCNSTVGVQVLNLVIFPSDTTSLPVFGADLVSLPGGKHLILLDAQPMENERSHQSHWKHWHQKYVIGGNKAKPNFAWGGDIPEQVARYVSDYALWTRLGAAAKEDDDNSSAMSPIAMIQTKIFDAFQEHLNLYLDLLSTYEESVVGGQSSENNEQEFYIQYRLNNDPAKPMLKSLYGEEFTERVLKEVLFPALKTPGSKRQY